MKRTVFMKSATSEQKSESATVEPPAQWQPFPIELLPPSMRDMATGVQHAIGLKDSSTSAIATLATVAGVIGSSCKIRIKQGYFQPAHLFTAIIGKSGQAKSGTKEYLTAPLRERQSEWFDDWEVKDENYKREMIEWKSAKKGEKPVCPTEPDPPQRIIISDITIETVGLRLKENPLGLLLYNDELETFFGSMGRYNNGNDLSFNSIGDMDVALEKHFATERIGGCRWEGYTACVFDRLRRMEHLDGVSISPCNVGGVCE